MTLPPRPDLTQLLLAAMQKQNQHLEMIKWLLTTLVVLLGLPLVYLFIVAVSQ